MRKIFHIILLGMLCLLVFLPAMATAQQSTSLPPTYYTAWMNQEGPSEAQAEADVGGEDEGDLSFLDKDLSEISRTQVTSPALSSDIETVSRTTQPLARTAAAVYVVTNEMIKRCGARNIPEVLRTVPGVNVARINASAWAITIRGLNSRFASKLLVQVDGVAIYNPTHGGVFWEREYVMLEDVDRIEVIRGPGGAVWGANAVNGVINIVTKSSKNTKGLYADGGGGNEHRQFGDFRVGSRVGNLHWRVYGMNVEDGKSYVPRPDVAADDLKLNQGGFRLDWTPNRCDTITVQGDFNSVEDSQTGSYLPPDVSSPMDCKRTTFLARWVRQIDEDTDWALQTYYYNPYAIGNFFNNTATFDIDFQYHFKRGRHDVVWGLGYRNSDERWGIRAGFYTLETNDTEQVPNYFIQDTITMVEDRFFVTVGSKFDHDSVTNFQYQPTIRVAWTPDERTSVWGAISRAVRVPALYERIYTHPDPEHVLAYEAGVRRQPSDRFYWEIATFFNRYNQLLGYSGMLNYENTGKADTYGFEINGTYEVNPRWHLTGWYAFIVQDVDFESGQTPSFVVGGTPRNQFYFQSGWDLGNDVTFDMMFRYVDSLAVGVNDYFVGDIRLAWRPTRNIELSVVGQNLFDAGHYEFVTSSGANATEVEPGVYGMISWRY